MITLFATTANINDKITRVFVASKIWYYINTWLHIVEIDDAEFNEVLELNDNMKRQIISSHCAFQPDTHQYLQNCDIDIDNMRLIDITREHPMWRYDSSQGQYVAESRDDALLIAVLYRQLDVIKCLIKPGTDLIADKCAMVVRNVANQHGYDEITEYLENLAKIPGEI